MHVAAPQIPFVPEPPLLRLTHNTDLKMALIPFSCGVVNAIHDDYYKTPNKLFAPFSIIMPRCKRSDTSDMFLKKAIVGKVSLVDLLSVSISCLFLNLKFIRRLGSGFAHFRGLI